MTTLLGSECTEQRIRTLLCDRLQIEPPARDEDLFQSGSLDSLSFVDMIVALEEEFSLHVSLEQIIPDNFRTIAAISAYIESQNAPVSV